MSLLNRTPISIGRAERKLRDDRIFLVATDDTDAPEQYFQALNFSRVRVKVLPTEEGLSAPSHVVQRLIAAFSQVKQKGEVQAGDQFWVLVDDDHNFGGSHQQGTVEALNAARQSGFEIAVSSPCFELWLLLHCRDLGPGENFPNCDAVVEALRTHLGGYNKTNIKPHYFPLESVPGAIAQAKILDGDGSGGYRPPAIGSRVYRLLEALMA